MKRTLLIIIALIITLVSCTNNSDIDIPENTVDISEISTTDIFTITSIPTATEVEITEIPEPVYIANQNIYDENVSEINFTELLGLETDQTIYYITPYDDEYIFVIYRNNIERYAFYEYCSIIHIKTETVVYTGKIIWGEGLNFYGNEQNILKTDIETGEKYIISCIPAPDVSSYYITYIYNNKIPEEKHLGTHYSLGMGENGEPGTYEGEELPPTKIYGNDGEIKQIVRGEDGGIFEKKDDGSLIELLPSEQNTSENWKDRISYVFLTQIDADKFLYAKNEHKPDDYWYSFSLPSLGIYNFKTADYTDIPDSQNLSMIDVCGNLIYSSIVDGRKIVGNIYVTNADTFETECFLDINEFIGNGELFPNLNLIFSPNGNYCALVTNPEGSSNYTIHLLDTTDSIIKSSYEITVPTILRAKLQFIDNDRLLLTGLNQDSYNFHGSYDGYGFVININ